MMVNLPCLMVSCTNFLRPTCSYTECPLSFLTGSCPTERTTASYGSCLYLIFTDLLLTPRKLIFSGRSLLFQLLVLLGCSVFPTPSEFTGFSSRTLLDFRTLRNPARPWISNAVYLYLCCLLIRSYYVTQHLLRIVFCPFC